MMKKLLLFLCISLFLLLSQYPVFCLKIHITDFNIYAENVDVTLTKTEKNATEIFYKLLLKKDFKGLLSIKLVSESKVPHEFYGAKVKSGMDAAELCELLHLKYLIYGYIKKTYKYYDAELKLFDNETKEVRKIFYEKIELGNIEELAANLAEKVVIYMHNILGFSKYHIERKKEFGGLGIYNSIGYWFPCGRWWDVLTGILSFETGVNVIPVTPLIVKRNFNFFMRYGFTLSYSLGVNKPELLKSYLNSINFKTPVEWCFEIYKRNVFVAGFGPQLQIDILYQEKLFDVPQVKATSAFGLFSTLGYEYWFGDKNKIAFGVKNTFDFTFFDNIFIGYKIQFYTIFRIGISEKKSEERNEEKSEERNEEKSENAKKTNAKKVLDEK